MVHFIALFLYQMIQLTLLVLLIPYTYFTQMHAEKPALLVYELAGMIPAADPTKNTLWIHGFSAGEISATQELVKMIKKDVVNSSCYITASTEEGKKIAEQQLAADHVCSVPHDDMLAMSIAFERIKPKTIILLEHEIRPSIIMMAHLKKIPVYLLNAQYTTHTKDKLSDYGFFYKPLLNWTDKIFVQSDTDKTAFETLGIHKEKIITTGNIKAFNALPKKQAALTIVNPFLENYLQRKDKPLILLVGSVHKGEIDHYINLYKELKPEFKSLKMIIAPRFFDWKQELESKVKATGYAYNLFDDPTKCPENPVDMLTLFTDKIKNEHDILIVCLMGKLFYMHAIADIYYLGGTFVPVGGHNLLEPTAWGNPTILGPQYENTKDIADELKKVNGVVQVLNETELIDQTRALLNNQQYRTQISNQAFAWFKHEAEYVRKNIQELVENINNHCAM